MPENIATILITVLTILGSSAAWKFYENRAKDSAQKQKDEDRQIHLFRDDLRDRVSVMEKKLEKSELEKNQFQIEITKLTKMTAALEVEVEFLRKENRLIRKLYEETGGALPSI